jgi:hypothetical protein
MMSFISSVFCFQSVFNALRGTAAHYSSDALLHTCTTSAYPRQLHLHDVSGDGCCTCTTSAETAAASALRQRRLLLHLHAAHLHYDVSCTLHTCIPAYLPIALLQHLFWLVEPPDLICIKSALSWTTQRGPLYYLYFIVIFGLFLL